MSTWKKISGRPVTTHKISVEKCLEALAHMQKQMSVILPYVPEHLTSKLIQPNLGLKPSLSGDYQDDDVSISTETQPNNEAVTEMFSLQKDLKCTTESDDDEDTDFESDPILVNSKLFLENFKSGAIKRELKKTKIINQVMPPYKPIRFSTPMNRPAFTIPILQQMEEPNIIKEQHPEIYLKSKNIFTTKEEAERFMMLNIKEIIHLFSQIANVFKSDAVKRMEYPPTDISQKAYMVGCCMQTMKELNILVNGPVKKLRNELTENFITVLPEFKWLEESNWSHLNTDGVSSNCYQRELAPGDGFC